MKQLVQYRIDTAYPRDTGLSKTVYNVVGTWTENGIRYTNGDHSHYGCDTFREARRVLREFLETKKYITL